MKTASYAVMFTDIQGFTERTSRQTRAENERLLRLHEALLLPVVRGYGGRRVKTIGDAYLVVFDSATRALACGAAIQDRLALYNAQIPAHDCIHVRIAINAGEVRIAKDDVYGEAVNIASRVEACTDAGEVCFTEAVLLLADRSYFGIDELGPHTLRGVPEPVRLFRLRYVRGAGLPYGGTALAPLGLPEPNPARLAARKGIPRVLRRAAVAAVALSALAGAGAWGWKLLDRPLPKVEKLADGGNVKEARKLLDGLPRDALTDAEVTYLEGVISLAAGDPETAIDHFEDAARADREFALDRVDDRLERLLEHQECEVREAAATTLGSLEVKGARVALEALARKEPGADGFFARLKLGGCNAGDAARNALRRIER